ncbi:hypothetical protein HBB16_01040 [Pseudonocardia sp. MCCB 268]|nr:hypothetical protein [Pseudonocardia cytotoxica]
MGPCDSWLQLTEKPRTSRRSSTRHTCSAGSASSPGRSGRPPRQVPADKAGKVLDSAASSSTSRRRALSTRTRSAVRPARRRTRPGSPARLRLRHPGTTRPPPGPATGTRGATAVRPRRTQQPPAFPPPRGPSRAPGDPRPAPVDRAPGVAMWLPRLGCPTARRRARIGVDAPASLTRHPCGCSGTTPATAAVRATPVRRGQAAGMGTDRPAVAPRKPVPGRRRPQG